MHGRSCVIGRFQSIATTTPTLFWKFTDPRKKMALGPVEQKEKEETGAVPQTKLPKGVVLGPDGKP